MEWTRSETLALATDRCAACQGLGLRTVEAEDSDLPCNCVLRNIFRACYARFRQCSEQERYISKVTLDAVQGREKKGTWGRKDEEYLADFFLVSKRALTQEEYRIFRFHFLLGADWKLCCRKLKIDKGTFFHLLYRIMAKLGRVYRETEPYALYPLDEYFHGEMKDVAALRYEMTKVVPIRPPLGKPRLDDFPLEKTA